MTRIPSFILLACLLLTNISLHTFVSGWGGKSWEQTSAGSKFGIAFNGTDNLSYCSWAQQGKRKWFFSNLYTTTPHKPLLFNPFFFTIGQLSGIFQTNPLLILNIVALAGIILFVTSMMRICDTLKFGPNTSFAVLCLSIGGGGISWIPYLLLNTRFGSMLNISGTGPDFSYLDLFPANAFSVYPYHAVSLALLALLVSILVAYEDHRRTFSFRQGFYIAIVATALSTTRPYEPMFLTFSYFLLLVLSKVFAASHEVYQRRKVILCCLALGTIPFLGYNLWVSSQPVWSYFSSQALNLFCNNDWIRAFFILWVLSAYGILQNDAWTIDSTRLLFLLWAVLNAFFLLVITSGLTKLSGGCTIPLSIAAGIGIEKFHGFPRHRAAIISGMIGIVLCSMASPIITHYLFAKYPERINPDFIHMQTAIQNNSSKKVLTILTDSRTGSLLPGLAGHRVYVGQRALTDHNDAKNDLLHTLGFHYKFPENMRQLIQSQKVQNQATILRGQITAGIFDYLILEQNQILAIELHRLGKNCLVYIGPRYCVYKMCPRVCAELEMRIRTIESQSG